MKRILLVLTLLLLGVACWSWQPAWSQAPGEGDELVAPHASSQPLSPKTPDATVSWNLTDLLWGLAHLQQSPQKLSRKQVAAIRPAIVKVVEGTKVVKNFEPGVKKVLTTQQLAYVQKLAVTGQLSKMPENLPDAGPGKDRLVAHVLSILEKKAK